MDYDEACSWLRGERSMTNMVPQDQFETWNVRIAQADAAMTQQAYFVAKAHAEWLLSPNQADDGRLVIHRHELNVLEEIRLELHEIAAHNIQVRQCLRTMTARLWPIIHKKREAA